MSSLSVSVYNVTDFLVNEDYFSVFLCTDYGNVTENVSPPTMFFIKLICDVTKKYENV
jgi:hypothetical protein